MKMTDDELIQAIWLYQLKQMAKRVITNFVGGRYAVNDADKAERFSHFFYSSYMWGGELANITTRLSETQRRKRVYKLIELGRLQKHDRSFHIDSPAARDAYESARQFWLSKGVPVFVYEVTPPVPLSESERLTIESECADFLLSKYGEVAA